MADFKNLTQKEIEKFLKNNQHGILSMAGDKPYALPMGYMYKRKKNPHRFGNQRQYGNFWQENELP